MSINQFRYPNALATLLIAVILLEAQSWSTRAPSITTGFRHSSDMERMLVDVPDTTRSYNLACTVGHYYCDADGDFDVSNQTYHLYIEPNIRARLKFGFRGDEENDYEVTFLLGQHIGLNPSVEIFANTESEFPKLKAKRISASGEEDIQVEKSSGDNHMIFYLDSHGYHMPAKVAIQFYHKSERLTVLEEHSTIRWMIVCIVVIGISIISIAILYGIKIYRKRNAQFTSSAPPFSIFSAPGYMPMSGKSELKAADNFQPTHSGHTDPDSPHSNRLGDFTSK